MKNYYTIIGFSKVLIGFVIVILIALFNVIFSYSTIQKNKNILHRLTSVINPYMETLDGFNLLVTRSKMLSTNWVYLQHNETDKESLVALHEKEYRDVREKLEGYVKLLGNKADQDTMASVFADFELILESEKALMEELATFEDYEIPIKKFTAEDLIESEIIPRSDILILQLNEILRQKREESSMMRQQMVVSSGRLMVAILVSAGGLFLLVLLAGFFTTKSIKEPVMRMREVVLRMGKGELPRENLMVTKDVIGDMGGSVNTLRESFSKTAEFAKEIEKGNFDAEFTPLSDKDMLGIALVNMRKSLKDYSEDMEQQVAERTREVVEKNAQLKVAYHEIKDSINYAKRIQEAIIPSVEHIFEAFPESFIFFRPKDIVSGDFYWFAKKGKQLIIAAVDCTGHGVPGALMTVVGTSIINQIVNLSSVTRPDKILTMMDEQVKETLQQHTAGSHTNDGMDVSLICYEPEQSKLLFAGANRSLLHFRNGESNEVRGNHYPIGSTQYGQKEFTSQEVMIEKKDAVYIFSDGFADQFGKSGKKFLKKRFYELLRESQHLPMKQQEAVLATHMDDWMGGAEQTDDMLVIGIRF